MLELKERLQAYLNVVELYPELPLEERQRLFSIALWPPDAVPEKRRRRRRAKKPNYEHLMQCRDPYCRECAGTGEVAA